MCVCVSVQHAVNKSAHLSNSAHYSPPHWYSPRVPNLKLHLARIPTLAHWCDNALHAHTKKKNLQHIMAQQNPTKHGAEVAQRNSQREEVDQPVWFFFFFFFFVFLRFSSHFSLCGVYAGWIPKRKRSWVGDKLRRSQSPPQRPRVAARTTGKEAGREAATRSSLIDTANRGKEFQMGGITGSIVWLAGTL